MPEPAHRAVLAAAVQAIGGHERPGQLQMADAIADSLQSGTHLLVQAGTGTGKSLGYLIPALVHSAETGDRVIIATATLALQAQLATKDIPAAEAAMTKARGSTPTTAILKGRTNYACLLKARDGAEMNQDSLIGGADLLQVTQHGRTEPDSVLGAEVVMLREWADEQLAAKGLADRDDAPPHSPRAWAQLSMPVRECLGAQRCPYGSQCFVEESRDRARAADVVVTNHALVAIDAMHGGTALPDHTALIIDEAHDLVSRVTGAASDELSPQVIERVARRSLRWLEDDLGIEFLESADLVREGLEGAELTRITEPGLAVVAAFASVRDVARRVHSALSVKASPGGGSVQGEDAEKSQAASAVKEVFDIAERMAALKPVDVLWVSDRERQGRQAVVAPLSVSGLMRDHVLSEVTTILTSATLKVGGTFESAAASVGLRRSEQVVSASRDHGFAVAGEGEGRDDRLVWAGVDVGSPFDYRKQGILYTPTSLPNPRRDGITAEVLTEVAELVWAAGGGTLGLFASQRNAEAAARHVRAELPEHTILCQGDAQLSELTRRFIAEPGASLFGTLSLWQGIDVPGQTCELVIIDKIPFPRPDDPLMQARQQAVAEAGGNGFMSVAAAHAALLLAQGSGRLIRRLTDRGVVAVLDPRLVTARYGSFLRASMPEFWATCDREVVVQALQRLQQARGENNTMPPPGGESDKGA